MGNIITLYKRDQVQVACSAVMALSSVGMLYFVARQYNRSSQGLGRGTRKPELFAHLGRSVRLTSREQDLLNYVSFPDELSPFLCDIRGMDSVLVQITVGLHEPLLYAKESKEVKTCHALFHGPPGTGKTMCARALAKSCNVPLLNVTPSTLKDKLYGESEQRVEAILTFAQKIAPVIIFIDEIETVLGETKVGGNEHNAALVGMIRSMLSGNFQFGHGVIVIASTNRKDRVDGPTLRRLPLQIEFPKPDQKDRREILQSLLDQEGRVASSEDVSALAQITEGYSNRDLEFIVNYAARLASSRSDFTKRGLSIREYQKKLHEQGVPPLSSIKKRDITKEDFLRAFRQRGDPDPRILE